MTDIAKTMTLVAIGLVALALGIFTQPRPPQLNTESMVGKTLFPDLEEPLKSKRIKITTYDEDAGRVREFEVAQVDGVWSIPSHKNYPADASDQMAAAATALFDLKVLDQVSDDANDHELYGVVEPDPSKDLLGQKGVGKLVELEDGSKKYLARLIIGKEDKAKKGDEFAGGQSKLRFVRVKGQDRVYRVAMSADKFSTKFENWIETDLLKMNPWDISQVELRDYSVERGITREGELVPTLNPRADIDLAYNDQDRESQWKLEKLIVYNQGEPVEEELGPNQELNVAKLNEMKSALDELKIVDVERKPTRMSANMKAGAEFMTDVEALRDLVRRGFTPAQVGENEFDIKSNDGEAIVGMKDGVEYVLRFGAIAGVGSASDEEGEAADDAEKADQPTDEDKDPEGGTVNRYVMVMARFNPDLLEKPELEPLPEIKTAPPAADAAPQDAAPAAETPADGKSDAGPADEAAKAPAEDGNSDDDPTAESASDEGQQTETPKEGEPSSDNSDSKQDTATADPQPDQETLERLRDKIELENRRKEDAYKEKVKAGEQRAKELNARFADWYYVISDSTYRKIHLGIGDIIVTKPGDEPEAGVQRLNPMSITNPFPPVPATPAPTPSEQPAATDAAPPAEPPQPMAESTDAAGEAAADGAGEKKD